jgi:spore coat polysaccharide biosynthesis protein SpsF
MVSTENVMPPNWGIVIQARLGSSRLPEKMIKPFAGYTSLLELILTKLLETFPAERIILATSDQPADDIIAEKAMKKRVKVFRGSEKDVLDRFLQATSANLLTHVVRVCADNPFLNVKFIQQLIEMGCAHPDQDYISFFLNDGRPVIRSHSGFFAEWVSLSALQNAAAATTDNFFREHVTNFIYSHPDDFRILKMPLLPARETFYARVRLTIDTVSDFDIAESLFLKLFKGRVNIDPEEIYEYLEENPQIKNEMRINIQNNEK